MKPQIVLLDTFLYFVFDSYNNHSSFHHPEPTQEHKHLQQGRTADFPSFIYPQQQRFFFVFVILKKEKN